MSFWRILQTETVAKTISTKTSRYISKYVSSDLVFERISFNLFPPGLNIHNVQFRSAYGRIKELEFDFSLIKLSVNPIDLIARKVTISEVALSNGVIKINDDKLDEEYYKKDLSIYGYLHAKIEHMPKSEDPEWLVKLKEIPGSEKVTQILRESFPVVIQSAVVNNVLITRNQDRILLKNIEAHVTRNNQDLAFHLQGINTTPFTNNYFKESIDELSGGLRYYKDKLKINSLTVKSDLNSFIFYGGLNEVSKKFNNIRQDIKFKSLVSLSKVSEYSTLHDILQVSQGAAEIRGEVQGKLKEPKLLAHVSIRDFISGVADAKEVEADLSVTPKLLRIEKGHLKSDAQYLKLDTGFELYNFERDRMVATPIVATFQNIPANNMLKALHSFMYPLHGEFSGRLQINHDYPNFIFKALSPLDMKKFDLAFKGKEENKLFSVIAHPHLKLNNSIFTYAYEKGRFYAKSLITSSEGTKLNMDGYVDGKEVSFFSKDSRLNLTEVKTIAGLKVKGQSAMDIDITGPIDDVHFLFHGPIYNFEFLDYKLGEMNGSFDLSLKTMDVTLNKTEGKYNNTIYETQGGIDLDTLNMGFDVDVKKTSYNDALEILDPLLHGLWFMPDIVNGEVAAKIKIGGKADPNFMTIKGRLNSKRLVYRDENFKSASYNFSYENNILNLTDIVLFKEIGSYRGSFQYDRVSQDFSIEGYIDQISLDEFSFIRSSPAELNGNIWGSIEGGRKNKHLNFKGSVNVKNSSVNNFRMDNSKFVFNVDDNLLTYELNLLGEAIKSNGEVFLETSSSNRSKLNIETNIHDPKSVFLAAFGKYLDIHSMDGTLRSHAHLEFDTKNFRDLDFDMSFDDWTLFLNNKRYSVAEKQSKILIENGNIEKLNFKMTGPGTSLRLDGQGNLKSNYGIQGEFNFDASILESLIKGMTASNGRIFNSFKVGQNNGAFDLDVVSKTDDLFLHYENIPTIFNRIKYAIYATEDRMNIEKLEANLNTGTLKILGDVSYLHPSFPRLNLSYTMDQAGFNYLGKTTIIASGSGDLTGDGPPYLLGGELSLISANIYNELEDFGAKETYSNEIAKFLPEKKGLVKRDWIKYDLNVETINPIFIKNSMAELSLVGNLLVKGTFNNVRLGGRLNTIPGSSRFFFKSNDFVLSRGIILFFEEEPQINPELDFFASSNIAEYAINMRIYGRAKNFNLDLTSEPALSQLDILSLITLGYTNDLSNNLGSGDRSALASAGIGGLLFDRFKINEGLKNSLGLKLSLSPEFREGGAGGNMLQGRGTTNTGSTGVNVRSGTKVELRKKVSESVDLAVSSTVGSNIGSKQSMNLNYNFNKVVGAEGVYEIRTNDEGIEDVVATSLGGDLKFKWTFK